MKSKAMWQAMKKQQEAIALEGKKWEIYHFESSDGCQHPDEIRLAHRYAAAKHQGPAQRAQLKAIVELEMARHSVLSGGMEMKPYQKKVQKVSDDYSHASNSHVFEETPAHEDFYSRLNYLDKLSKWVPKTASAAFCSWSRYQGDAARDERAARQTWACSALPRLFLTAKALEGSMPVSTAGQGCATRAPA